MNLARFQQNMGALLEASATTPWGRQALTTLVANVQAADHAGRHDALYAAALKAGSYIGANQLDEHEATDALVAAGIDVGLPRKRAEHHTRNGIARGRTNPIGPADRHMTAGPEVARRQADDWCRAVAASDEDAHTKACLLAIGQECAAHGRFETSQSMRQVAELAGVSVSTVHKRTARMGRWLVVLTGGQGMKSATTWRLLPVKAPQSAAVAVPAADRTKDVFHQRKGLWLAFSALDEHEPTNVAELAKAAGVTVRTAKKYVKDGVAAGIMAVVAGGIVAVAGAALLMPAEKAENRRLRHIADRVRYKAGRVRAAAARAAERLLPRSARDALAKRRRTVRLTTRARRHETRVVSAPTLRPPGADRFGPSVGLGA